MNIGGALAIFPTPSIFVIFLNKTDRILKNLQEIERKTF